MKAVELHLARGKDKAVADELGIGRSTLQKWEKRYRGELNPVLINEAEELRRLQKENARLAEEIAILKKQQRSSPRMHFQEDEVRVHRRRTRQLSDRRDVPGPGRDPAGILCLEEPGHQRP